MWSSPYETEMVNPDRGLIEQHTQLAACFLALRHRNLPENAPLPLFYNCRHETYHHPDVPGTARGSGQSGGDPGGEEGVVKKTK